MLAEQLRATFGVSACVTASSEGCALAAIVEQRGPIPGRHERVRTQAALAVTPTDVTGASDAFCAALARQLADDEPRTARGKMKSYLQGIRDATAAGGLAIEKLGSSETMPEQRAVQAASKRTLRPGR